MKNWFNTPLGASIVDSEIANCAKLIPSRYYASGLQVGMARADFLRTTEVTRTVIVDTQRLNAYPKTEKSQYVVSTSDALPFPEKSQDIIVLPHTLDFCNNPHDVLRQANQILNPEGCLVIAGFNVASLFGAIKLFDRTKTEPWCGSFHSVKRVQDWLALLGYDLVGARMMAYQPPMQSDLWRQRTAFFESAGDRWWPGLGGVYIIVGRKKEMSITPDSSLMSHWQRLIPGMAQAARKTASQRAEKIGMRLVVKN
jgi:SAM-dependent methyltransferase